MSGFVEGFVGVALTRRNNRDPVLRWALGAGRLAVVGHRLHRRSAIAELPEYPRWLVARVRVGFEFAVADDLSAAGSFCGYAPHRVVVHPRARVPGPSEVRKPVERDYPVFPGYVFVGCPAGVYVSRRSHDAVLAVLGDDLGCPGLSQAAMVALNRLHVVGALQPRSAAPLAKGERVTVDLGGVDVPGVVQALTRAGVRVDVEVFGQLTPVDVGLDRLKRVAL